MSSSMRFCPLCARRFDAERACPDDGVPTVEVGAVTVHAPKRFTRGTAFGGGYELLEPIGSGGMGEVYVALQRSVRRKVAVKVLLELGGPGAEQRIKRFYQEAQAASALVHPNLVRVYDFGVDDATHLPFLVMEHVEGETLAALLKRERRLSEVRAAELLAQVARGLVEVHHKGIVHRDLKPRNIMVTTLADGHVHAKLLDFGIARMRAADVSADPERLTAEGVAIGTPEYMSPEQTRGLDPDFRSDLYSLGCVLHELVTGRPPFELGQPVMTMVAHVRDPIPPLDGPLADGRTPTEGLQRLHASLLAKSRDDRPASTADVARSLGALATNTAELPAPITTATAPATITRPATHPTLAVAPAGPSSEGLDVPASNPPSMGLVAGGLISALVAVGAAIAFVTSSSAPEPAPVRPVEAVTTRPATTAPELATTRPPAEPSAAVDAGSAPEDAGARTRRAIRSAPDAGPTRSADRASPERATERTREELAPATSYP